MLARPESCRIAVLQASWELVLRSQPVHSLAAEVCCKEVAC